MAAIIIWGIILITASFISGYSTGCSKEKKEYDKELINIKKHFAYFLQDTCFSFFMWIDTAIKDRPKMVKKLRADDLIFDKFLEEKELIDKVRKWRKGE